MLEKQMILSGFGGVGYGLLELIWRGRTHWSMLLAGGLCFAVLGLLNLSLAGRMRFWTLAVMGAVSITAVEFGFGVVFNLCLQMDVWDYSHLPVNLYGQVCLPFTALWVIVSALGLRLDRFLRRVWFGDEIAPRAARVRGVLEAE